MNRKGISVYVSWVLVMTFVVLMSVFMFNFMRDFAMKQTDDIKKRALDTVECDAVAVTIDYACQNTQDLYINVTNRGDRKIDTMLFRFYDLYYEPQIDEKKIDLLVGRYNAKEVSLVKRGSVKKVRFVEAVPILIADGVQITCENRMASYPMEKEAIDDCLYR